MSFAVNSTHHVEVAKAGAILATYDGENIVIWPGGTGVGPVISMSREDWQRISREVAFALSRAAK